MRTRLKRFYCYIKKKLGFNDDDYWDNNPYVVF